MIADDYTFGQPVIRVIVRVLKMRPPSTAICRNAMSWCRESLASDSNGRETGGRREPSSPGRLALRELERSINWDDTDLSVFGRIVMEYGLRFNAMRIEWAEWAVEQFE